MFDLKNFVFFPLSSCPPSCGIGNLLEDFQGCLLAFFGRRFFKPKRPFEAQHLHEFELFSIAKNYKTHSFTEAFPSTKKTIGLLPHKTLCLSDAPFAPPNDQSHRALSTFALREDVAAAPLDASESFPASRVQLQGGSVHDGCQTVEGWVPSCALQASRLIYGSV